MVPLCESLVNKMGHISLLFNREIKGAVSTQDWPDTILYKEAVTEETEASITK